MKIDKQLVLLATLFGFITLCAAAQTICHRSKQKDALTEYVTEHNASIQYYEVNGKRDIMIVVPTAEGQELMLPDADEIGWPDVYGGYNSDGTVFCIEKYPGGRGLAFLDNSTTATTEVDR